MRLIAPWKVQTKQVEIAVVDMPGRDGQGKKWVKVRPIEFGDFAPSFEEIALMIQMIAHCERLKYQRGQGASRVRAFVSDSMRQFSTDERAMIDHVATVCSEHGIYKPKELAAVIIRLNIEHDKRFRTACEINGTAIP